MKTNYSEALKIAYCATIHFMVISFIWYGLQFLVYGTLSTDDSIVDTLIAMIVSAYISFLCYQIEHKKNNEKT